MPGTDVAVYWIEYVLRHGGTKHLQPAAKNLPFYQLYFLDAFAVAAVIAIFLGFASYFLLRKLLNMLLGKKLKQS